MLEIGWPSLTWRRENGLERLALTQMIVRLIRHRLVRESRLVRPNNIHFVKVHLFLHARHVGLE